ncbi:hypothetical protein J2X69_000014 [Algoriphagus sp. 4150]|uniref:hypothetical protein n=1 Tax=Algoriphagus sp. 4150 TaxID=2817756 RepID=UPI0028601A4D|nr:hypothetical protein [Algoriphagus sp. 4150]MDR7127686.1 hypothetical protein [Algoriphagus sp. 4150]
MKNTKFLMIIYVILLLNNNKIFGQVNQDSTFIDSNILRPFSEFEEIENEKEEFIQELLQLDSLLQFENYLDRIHLLKFKKLSVDIKNGVINLDFSEIYCKEYSKLNSEDQIPNIEVLRAKKKVSFYCRSIASDLDVFPKRTGNLEKDCELYSKAIKKLITANQEVLQGWSYEKYLRLEVSRNINTSSEKFVFRKKFLKFLHEKYYVYIE